MGLGNIDGWGSALGCGLRLVGSVPMMLLLSSLEVHALRHHHRLSILDLAFVEAEV